MGQESKTSLTNNPKIRFPASGRENLHYVTNKSINIAIRKIKVLSKLGILRILKSTHKQIK